MGEPSRPRAASQLQLTRNHLHALGALSLALALLAFFVGYSLGKDSGAAPVEAPARAGLVPGEVKRGDLEVLLTQVERAGATDATLAFPSELPKTEPPPAPPVDPAAAAAAPGSDPAAPPASAATAATEAPPAPAVQLFPPEARPGTAALSGGGATRPTSTDGVPSGGWSVEIGEHGSEADAERSVATLRAAGLAAYRVVAIVGGTSVWRVRVGGYGSKDAAAAALPTVSSKAGAPGARVTPAP